MNLLLIKTGKVFSQLKNIGIFGTARKIFSALLLMVKSPGVGDVLFITNGTGDSARYRTRNIAEELEKNGFICSITVQDNLWLEGCAKKFRIFIFHRVVYEAKIAKLIEKIKTLNGEIIFETDDLTFDPRYMKRTENYKNLNELEKKQYENGLGAEILGDPYVKTCTTTTAYLAKILEGYDKKVFIVPNKLSGVDLKITGKMIRKKSGPDPEKIRIGYFSGSKSHDRDFATIIDVLVKIMEKYSSAELVLAGPLDTKNKLAEFGRRVKFLPYVSRQKHFENIASVDINIVPLETGDSFCESKSELKFFEAGILGVPTVAAATQTFLEAVADGIDGFIASAGEEWFFKIEKLVLDENLRQEIGRKAREKALRNYSIKNSRNEEYYNYLRNKLK